MSASRPTIGLLPTIAITIGAMVGSGIFVSPAAMARSSVSGQFMLLIWIGAGVLTLFGALSQCELCGSMPRSGGLYTYLREAFGDTVAFFYGWANFMIAGSGGIAAVAFILASYAGEMSGMRGDNGANNTEYCVPYLGCLVPMANIGEKLIGSAVVFVLTWVNVRGVRAGATLQTISTSLKLIALMFVIGTGFSHPNGSFHNVAVASVAHQDLSWLQALGLAVVAVSGSFWAYDGWGNVAYVAGEVERPERNVPLALVIGTMTVITVYLLVNAAYLYSLSVDGLGQVIGDRPASAIAGQVLGAPGARIIAAIIILSTFDATNSGVLTNARVYHAMADQGLFPRRVGKLHDRYMTPYVALWAQCLWTIVLLVSGSFELVTSMYVWVNWLFYLLMVIAVFKCRQRGLPRTFTIKGYPWVPAIFMIFTIIYLALTLAQDVQAYQSGQSKTINSLMGLALVASGLPMLLMTRYVSRLHFGSGGAERRV